MWPQTLTAKVDIDGCNVTGINFIAGFRRLMSLFINFTESSPIREANKDLCLETYFILISQFCMSAALEVV